MFGTLSYRRFHLGYYRRAYMVQSLSNASPKEFYILAGTMETLHKKEPPTGKRIPIGGFEVDIV